jgi:hypothetical protein
MDWGGGSSIGAASITLLQFCVECDPAKMPFALTNIKESSPIGMAPDGEPYLSRSQIRYEHSVRALRVSLRAEGGISRPRVIRQPITTTLVMRIMKLLPCLKLLTAIEVKSAP